jgi:hypothetical protein
VNSDSFDVIVIGAGMAGLSCAAELVLRGRRPLLVAETSEVALTLRSTWVGRNRGVVQLPFIGQDRYWYNQARELNIPLKLHLMGSLAVKRRGGGPVTTIPYCPSASSLTEAVEESFGFPSEATRRCFERIMHAAFAIPWSEIVEMDRVPLVEWLNAQKADEFTTGLLVTFAGIVAFMSAEETAKHISMFGAMANFRTIFALEGPIVMTEPDLRDGLAIPMAREIERRGGEVWRGRKVDRVLIDNNRATGVVLEDGTAARAPIVAIATGNSRIPKILDPMPDACREAIAYSSQFQPEEFSLFTVLSKPVIPDSLGRSWFLYFDESGTMMHAAWALETIMPWTTEPGKQFIFSQQVKSSMADVDEVGGIEAVFADMFNCNEELFPGFNEAVENHATNRHKHLWGTPLSIGPKLPRKTDDIDGLWFVGDGSRPIRHLYTEGAASAGILGARAMVAELT